MRGMESGGGGTATSSDFNVRYSLGQNVLGDATSLDHIVAHSRGSSMKTNPVVLTDEEIRAILIERM